MRTQKSYYKRKGYNSWCKGIRLPFEVRERMRETALRNSGVRSENGRLGAKNRWEGHIVDNQPYGGDWTDILREAIRQRDNYICQECGTHQDELNYKLDIHHIDYDKENCDPKNLVSLCRRCHVKTNYNRDYWQDYFIKNLKSRR